MGKVKPNDTANQISDIYYNDLKSCVPLTRKREKELFVLAKKGDLNARNEIIKSNLRYVVVVANRMRGYGYPLSELISEGNMGLIRAFESFDETKGIRFYCYAIWWIRQYMQAYIKKMIDTDNVEVSNHDDSFEDGKSLFEKGSIGDAEDYNSDSDDLILNTNGQSSYDNDGPAHIASVIEELMSTLSDRERLILRKYYGFDDKPKNLEEIGDELNITQERVRQIKSRSIKKMRQEILLKPNLTTIYR